MFDHTQFDILISFLMYVANFVFPFDLQLTNDDPFSLNGPHDDIRPNRGDCNFLLNNSPSLIHASHPCWRKDVWSSDRTLRTWFKALLYEWNEMLGVSLFSFCIVVLDSLLNSNDSDSEYHVVPPCVHAAWECSWTNTDVGFVYVHVQCNNSETISEQSECCS